VFQADDVQMSQIASEAAIACNLVHDDVVATYGHDLHVVDGTRENELQMFKFYLIQVRRSWILQRVH
jgi:hypothetical protein